MRTATTHAGATADASAVSITEAITSTQQERLHNIEAAGAAMLEGLTKAQSEISDFIAERVRQDVDAQAEMLRCRTFEDVRDLQTRFFKTAMDQYAAEVNRLLKIGTDTMQQSLASQSPVLEQV